MNDRIARHYQGDRAGAYFRYQEPLAELFGEIGAQKFQPYVARGDFVVDFGAGSGHTLAALSAGRKVGIEPIPQNRASAESLGIETVEQIDELGAGEVDVVVSNHALEHTLAPYAELNAIFEALRPGGKLALVVPVDDWRTQKAPRPRDPNHHLYGWTPLSLANLLSDTGFEVQACRVVNWGYPGRLTGPLARILPPGMFAHLCRLTAVVLKRREIRAVARKPPI